MVKVTVTVIQGHRCQKKKKGKTFYANYLTKLLMDLDEIWDTVEINWYGEPQSQPSVLEGENPVWWLL